MAAPFSNNYCHLLPKQDHSTFLQTLQAYCTDELLADYCLATRAHSLSCDIHSLRVAFWPLNSGEEEYEKNVVDPVLLLCNGEWKFENNKSNFKLIHFFITVKSALPFPLDNFLTSFWWLSFQRANQNARTMVGGDFKLHVRVLTIDISASHNSWFANLVPRASAFRSAVTERPTVLTKRIAASGNEIVDLLV